jgi:hypothetical protein
MVINQLESLEIEKSEDDVYVYGYEPPRSNDPETGFRRNPTERD